MTLTRFRGSAADTGGMINADLPFRKRLKGELTGHKLKAALENVCLFIKFVFIWLRYFSRQNYHQLYLKIVMEVQHLQLNHYQLKLF